MLNPQSIPVQERNNWFIRNARVSQTPSEVPSEVVIKCHIKYGSRWSACKGLMAEYAKNSSIHGLRYIFEIHRPLYEKLLWFILVMMSSFAALNLMWRTYSKWSDSPVIVVFDEHMIPIYKIPFPTVTICPEVKTEVKYFDFTEVSYQVLSEIEDKPKQGFSNRANLSDVEIEQLVAMLQICEKDVWEKFVPHMHSAYQTNDRVAKVLVNLTMNLNGFIGMVWNNRNYYGQRLLRYVLTEDGVCLQFNGLKTEDIFRDPSYLSYHDDKEIDYNSFMSTKGHSKYNDISGNWSLEEGYIGQGLNSYPQRLTFSSVRNGFSGLLTGHVDDLEYACRSYKQGYKVFINSPESVPVSTSNYILMPHKIETLVSLLPHLETATPDLRSVDPEKRQCYFNNERYLRFFKSYSQSNCETECLTNITISHCGCATFWMPKPRNVAVCGLSDARCYSRATDSMNEIIANQNYGKSKNLNQKPICDCKPACTSLQYNFEISRSHFKMESTISAFREKLEDGVLGSRLAIYFKEQYLSGIKRTVAYDSTQLVANFGGILALMLGISILSIVEFIYFFSLRMLQNICKRLRATRDLKLQMDNLYN